MADFFKIDPTTGQATTGAALSSDISGPLGGNAFYGDGSDSASDTLTKAITGFTNVSAGNMAFTVDTTLTGFDFYVGGTVTISGTTNYNGTYTIIGSGVNSFNFAHEYNGTETGSVTGDVKLMKDMFFDSPNIGDKIVHTNGFRWFVKTKITIHDGQMTCRGNNGVSGTAGAAIGSQTLGPNPYMSGAGGNGSNAQGSAGSGMNTLSLGGAGGEGGDGDFGSQGGIGGTCTAPTATQGSIRQLPQLLLGYLAYGGVLGAISGGGGGGGGAGFGAYTGGGGASGGGVNIFGAKEIEITGSGSINSDGGTGADGQTGGNTGSGAGGGGGFVGGVYGTLTVPGTIAQSIHATGGLPGTPQGTGTTGTVGADGTVVLIQN